MFKKKKNAPVFGKGRSRDIKYAFDRVFNETSTNLEVYEKTTEPLIDYVLDGVNASVFAYGATGSGKTHTMIGEEDEPGVMVHTMHNLFSKMESSKDKITVKMSYLEIYNEQISDLLVENSPPLMLCEGPKGIDVPGISKKSPKTAEEVFELLEFGNKNRKQSPTDANAVSSRSHAILMVKIKRIEMSTKTKITSKLNLIDLAGSERAAASSNKGQTLREGAKINTSLLALGNCINSLGEHYKKGKHVPYRNSKLTRLLQDSLGGNCKTVMIATISQSSNSFEETLNTLKYANRGKNIKTNVRRNTHNINFHLSEYKKIIDGLRNEVLMLKKERDQAQNEATHYKTLLEEALSKSNKNNNNDSDLPNLNNGSKVDRNSLPIEKNITFRDDSINEQDEEEEKESPVQQAPVVVPEQTPKAKLIKITSLNKEAKFEFRKDSPKQTNSPKFSNNENIINDSPSRPFSKKKHSPKNNNKNNKNSPKFVNVNDSSTTEQQTPLKPKNFPQTILKKKTGSPRNMANKEKKQKKKVSFSQPPTETFEKVSTTTPNSTEKVSSSTHSTTNSTEKQTYSFEKPTLSTIHRHHNPTLLFSNKENMQ